VDYISPEQACGRADLDARSDIYALGCSLYHMATGELPFTGTHEEIMYGHVKRPVEFAPAHKARVSPPVQYVIRKAMAKSPDDRYATGRELVDEIRTLGAAILARPLVVPEAVRSQAIESAPIPAAPPAGRPPLRTAQPPRPGLARPGTAPRPGLRRPGGDRGRPGR
jgi:serine/threonine-protein kinase